MRVAIIDLGTNSVRFDVHEIVHSRLKGRPLYREKVMIRLGQGVFVTGRLDPAAVRRAVLAFGSFRKTCKNLGVSKVIAFATSTLREAADADRFVHLIKKKTGFELRVISGEEEARLIARGILRNEPKIKSRGRFVIVDIGGGSTEVILCDNKRVVQSVSLNLGTARLQQIFLKSSPPRGKRDPIQLLRDHIREVAEPVLLNAKKWPDTKNLIGSSGSIRALVRIGTQSPSEKKVLEKKHLSALVRQMSRLSTSELLAIPLMEAKRVDMILAGGILLDELARLLGSIKIQATEYSLRDGILDQELRRIKQGERTHLSDHLDTLFRRALRFGVHPSHTRQVATLCNDLFDRLSKLHRLRPEWRNYLTAAAYLHDTGKSIHSAGHELHSYYIAINLDLPMLDDWEREFIATLCLLHNRGNPDKADLAFLKNTESRKAFPILLSILRLADSLDRTQKSAIQLTGLRTSRHEITLRVRSQTDCDLETLRVEQKKDLFEKVFRKKLNLLVTK